MKYLRHINESKNIVTCNIQPFSCKEDDIVEIKALFSKLKLNINLITEIEPIKNKSDVDLIDKYLSPAIPSDKDAYHATASDIVKYIFSQSGVKLNLSKIGSVLNRLGFKGQYKQKYNFTKHKSQSIFVYLLKNK